MASMARPNLLHRIFGSKTLADTNPAPHLETVPVRPDLDPKVEDESETKTIIVHTDPVGSSGIFTYYGYVQEDYLQNLRGHLRADVFDKMRRSDSQIKMALAAVKNPIKAANWAIEPGDDSAEAKADAALIEHILFHDMDKPWPQTLHEILSCIDFGHSIFEKLHKAVVDHPKFGSYIGLRQLAFRSPRTIHRFNVDGVSGKLVSVTQFAYGDLERNVDIPSEFLVLFSLEQEGDNYEGISWLRPCYGPWLRKDMYKKLMSIGIEKYAVPSPVAEVPEGKQNSKEYANLIAALQIWTSHQQNYLTLPAGWKVDFKSNPFDAQKIQAAIDGENKDIINGFLANFLDLGTGGGGGSYALGNDKSEFFLTGIEHIGKHIADVINKNLICELTKMNRGPREVYPKLVVSGIADKGGQELANSLKLLCESQVVRPDDKLEDQIRGRYNLPKRSDIGVRTVNSPGSPPVAEAGAPAPDASKKNSSNAQLSELKLAEKTARAHIGECKKEIKDVMQTGLKNIADAMISQLISKASKATPSQQRSLVNSISQPGSGAYKIALTNCLASTADGALIQARKEVPKAKNVKLAEFDDLPKEIQDKIKAQANLLTDSQLADLEKAIYFQFDASIDSTDSMATLEKDLDDAVDKYLEGVSVDAAAGNVASTVVNAARNAFFFSDDVVEQIASFTFTNPAPISPICQDLAGTTFAKDDASATRYFPPLHHNCKSYLVPNLTDGPRADKEVEDLKPSKADLEKYITLHEGHSHHR